MIKLTRRSVLKTLAISAVMPAGGGFLAKPKLSFSTLGCPAWDITTILKAAVASGYQGVEFRGVLAELDLPKCPEFSTAARAAETRNRFADQGIQICGLGSSAQLHHANPVKRAENLDHARRFIDLAHQLQCPYVRVFPDQLPSDQPRNTTMTLISDGLLTLGDYAKTSSVSVLLESHGELTRTKLLTQIMEAAKHPHVGLIWDIFNMWADASETPTEVYRTLRPYIRHVHVKDARTVADKHNYVLLGQGDAPLHEAISALKAGGYDGYYSFEWEKRWHPDIAEPEVAIPHYPGAMKTYF